MPKKYAYHFHAITQVRQGLANFHGVMTLDAPVREDNYSAMMERIAQHFGVFPATALTVCHLSLLESYEHEDASLLITQ